jgi:hypothetical protein
MILAMILAASTVAIVAIAVVIIVALIAPIPRCADAKRTGGPRARGRSPRTRRFRLSPGMVAAVRGLRVMFRDLRLRRV